MGILTINHHNESTEKNSETVIPINEDFIKLDILFQPDCIQIPTMERMINNKKKLKFQNIWFARYKWLHFNQETLRVFGFDCKVFKIT